MRLVIHPDYESVSRWTALYIADRITAASREGKPFVLGLPTGSSSLGIYRELIALHKRGALSFAGVITFNMDEYAGLPEDHEQSYHRFMWDNFFSHIDIDKNKVHILNGMAKDPVMECEAYEAAITACGGIDLFLGGAGADGHIAFNEPGSSLASRTRVKTLTAGTRIANARFFGGDPQKVPDTALTVGVGTVMDAREVIIIVSGYNKARALRRAVEGGVSQMCTLSCLQMHRKAIIVCDDAATEELKVGTVRYFKGIEG
ncbi:MAG: glucosamine-6-phosphate deaminase [Spirochaetaceae bacterium]|jgi:glucosamine-6-phosphate deaminase|nr:glucosamine-6-phosphate deaminase [Spirochaetaceae bacterium]